MRSCPLLDRKNITTQSVLICCNTDLQWHHTNVIAAYYFFLQLNLRVKNQGTYLVLVLQPTSCCSWMRAANCCWSATSLPWACLMKGCSRRWVTDGRASKSFIRHLTITKNNRGNTSDRKGLFKSEWDFTAKEEAFHHLSIVESWFVWISSDTSREPAASVLKPGSLICRSLSEYHMVASAVPQQSLFGLGAMVIASPISDVQRLPIGDVTLWYRPVAAIQHRLAAETNGCKNIDCFKAHTPGRTNLTFISEMFRDKKRYEMIRLVILTWAERCINNPGQ